MPLTSHWPVAVRRRRAAPVSSWWPISGRTQPRVRNCPVQLKASSGHSAGLGFVGSLWAFRRAGVQIRVAISGDRRHGLAFRGPAFAALGPPVAGIVAWRAPETLARAGARTRRRDSGRRGPGDASGAGAALGHSGPQPPGSGLGEAEPRVPVLKALLCDGPLQVTGAGAPIGVAVGAVRAGGIGPGHLVEVGGPGHGGAGQVGAGQVGLVEVGAG
jgi:hypothetical protein